MLTWIWEWLWWLGWYALVLGGWFAWVLAHLRAERLERDLTHMAHSLRYTDRAKT